MNKSNGTYKQFLRIIFLILFIVSCGGGGGGGDDDDDDNNGGNTNQVPVAVAGDDFLASRNFNVTLDGSGSSDADGDTLTFTWTQTAGPDVTGGTGILTGETPVFQAPSDVCTLIFELVVNDGQEDSVADTMGINVLEDANAGFFVDGDNGSDDTGNGSVETPFASIAKALCEVTQEQQDIYVKTLDNAGVYDETLDPCPGEPARSTDNILTIPTGTSLYGGYDGNGIRDQVNNPTLVATTHHGIIFTDVNLNAWFSGFNVASNNSPGPETSVYALSVLGGSAGIMIHDNQLIAGDVDFGNAPSPGTSHGLRVALIESASIERNVIEAGFGGDGLDIGNVFSTAAERGEDGFDAGGRTAGGGGDGRGTEDYDGGSGGGGGGVAAFGIGGYGSAGAAGQGDRGGAGGARGGCLGCGGAVGGPGGGGYNGAIGFGGNGSGGMEVYEDGGFFASYTTGNGGTGSTGEAGHGGGGGGGGRGNLIYSGGGGGGGGGGGAGGAGGPGGPGGGASIGLLIATVNTALIDNNEITSGAGGYGATGGQGQIGGDGGASGDGAAASAGNGGDGGIGGTGGNGGRGGAGGGGPSYGILIGSLTGPTITNNFISSGDGGLGGYGGSGGNGGNGGNTYAVYDTDLDDDTVPFLTNNTSSFSVPGEGGGTSGEGGSSGETGGSGVINW
jgi:K319L-like, PKD domain